jgi:hypothetical protein
LVVERLPLTANGKVNRRALPEPEWSGEARGGGYVGPRDPIEELVASAWAEVLGRERVSMTDDVFDLGAHSLHLVRVFARLRATLQVLLPLRTGFERSVLADLAAAVRDAPRLAGTAPTPMVRRPWRSGFLTSHSQRRLWFEHQLRPDSAVYNMHMGLRLGGPLDFRLLTRATNLVIERHEVLRTTFRWESDELVQVIGRATSRPLKLVDVADLPADEQEVCVRRIGRDSALQTFDLEAGPLYDLTLVRSGPSEHRLLMTFHHIVLDGWSVSLFLRELFALYEADVAGGVAQLPKLAVQFADYAGWERGWVENGGLEAELEFWRSYLADAPTLDLVPETRRPAVRSDRGDTVGLDVAAEIVDKLSELGRRLDATLFTLLLTAFGVLMAEVAGVQDVTIGTDVANRPSPETEPLLGCFVNQIPIRLRPATSLTWSEAVTRVRDAIVAALGHEHVPFDLLVEALNPPRRQNRAPFFDVKFVLQNTPGPDLAENTLAIETVGQQGTETSKFDLTVTAFQLTTGLHVSWEYAADLLEGRTVELWAARFAAMLDELVTDPDGKPRR